MFMIETKNKSLTRATAQEALNALNPSPREKIRTTEVKENPKIPGLVIFEFGMKSAEGRLKEIQNLINEGRL